ncbi:MAG: trypsin-like peptidase domain-containing protein [Eubacteriales bacterium]|nr:trypsin-like peptidase domain-containing protein [Eubacteriales bacterium]
MDEFHRNTSQNPNESEEQTTPFQTPVRGSSPGGAQHQDAQQNTQRMDYGTGPKAGGDSRQQNPYSQNTQQGTDSRSGQNTQSSGNPYSQPGGNPYGQWGPPGGQPKKPKKGSKGIKIAICGVIIALAAFAGGIVVSGGLPSGPAMSSQDGNVSAAGSGLPEDSTKVQITNTQTTGEGEDADDGKTSTQIYKEVSPSIVSIIADDITLGEEASGSGVIMSADGYIITNQHVVDGGNKFTVLLSDGTQYEAELIGEDDKTDLAVLKIDPKEDLTAAEFGESDKLEVGDRCYAIGSPGGVEYQNTFTGGYISAINRDVTINDRVMTLLQTDAAINPGSSGGALINKYGQVIGITSSKLSSSSSSEASFEGMGFAIPMSTAEDIVNELIAYGKVTGRPAIGISGYDVDETAAKYYDVPQGVLVSNVDEASDAYAQGVKANDIIIKVNGKEITCMSDINTIKEDFSAGDKMTLTVYRSGKTKDIEITLMDESDLDSSSSSSSSSGSEEDQDGYYGYGTNPYYGYGYGDGNSYSTNPFSGYGY